MKFFIGLGADLGFCVDAALFTFWRAYLSVVPMWLEYFNNSLLNCLRAGIKRPNALTNFNLLNGSLGLVRLSTVFYKTVRSRGYR